MVSWVTRQEPGTRTECDVNLAGRGKQEMHNIFC